MVVKEEKRGRRRRSRRRRRRNYVSLGGVALIAQESDNKSTLGSSAQLIGIREETSK